MSNEMYWFFLPTDLIVYLGIIFIDQTETFCIIQMFSSVPITLSKPSSTVLKNIFNFSFLSFNSRGC